MKTSACRDGTLKNQPNKMDNTFTPSLHLVSFRKLWFVFVSYVHRGVVESSGVGSAGCGVHVAWGLIYVAGGCSVVAWQV